MKYAYFEVVKNADEKKARQLELKHRTKEDENYYSSYIQIAEWYNSLLYECTALKSLKAAIRKGKVNIVVVPGIQGLSMQPMYAYCFLCKLAETGVSIAFGSPENIQTPDNLIAALCEAEDEYIYISLFIPMFTMEYCYVNRFFVYLEKDIDQLGERLSYYEKRFFIDVVRERSKYGFDIYDSDNDAFYHISEFMAERMQNMFDIGYQTLSESICLNEEVE